MLQTNQAIGARSLDTPLSLDAGAAGAAPDHVDPLLWKLASPSERESLSQPGNAAAGRSSEAVATDQAATLSPAQPGALAAPRAAAQAPSATAPASADQAVIVKVTDQFRARFSEAARDPAQFGELLRKSFGEGYDTQAAEGLRQQALRNDFSWMPKIEVVSQAQLADVSGTQGEGVAQGAYSQSTDTVFISRELLNSDPVQAERILCEEMGHALDARLNTQDAAGDEGDLFSALLHGDNVSDAQLQAMRADNDHGVINVNGQRVEVEYGFFKKLVKKVTGAVKSVGNFVANTAKAAVNVAVGVATLDTDRIKDGLKDGVNAAKTLVKDAVTAVKETWKDLKDDFQKLMQSKVFAAVLMVARFIPIPVVQLVVRVIDLVKAAYSVYQGVKHKSFGAVLGGVAGLAGGAANFAGALGASASTVNTIQTVATTAKTASMAYNAIATKDFAGAAVLAAEAFGAPKGVTDTLKTIKTVDNVVKAVENKDYAGAVTGAANLMAGPAGKALGVTAETAQTAQQAARTVAQVQGVVKAVEKKDYAAAVIQTGNLLDASPDVKGVLNKATQVQQLVKAVEKNPAAGAVAVLAAGAVAADLVTVPAEFKDTLKTAQQVQKLVKAVEKDDYTAAVKTGAAVLGFKEQTFNGLDNSTEIKAAVKPAAAATPKQATQELSDVWANWATSQARN